MLPGCSTDIECRYGPHGDTISPEQVRRRRNSAGETKSPLLLVRWRAEEYCRHREIIRIKILLHAMHKYIFSQYLRSGEQGW
jgi:hypothetical protein